MSINEPPDNLVLPLKRARVQKSYGDVCQTTRKNFRRAIGLDKRAKTVVRASEVLLPFLGILVNISILVY